MRYALIENPDNRKAVIMHGVVVTVKDMMATVRYAPGLPTRSLPIDKIDDKTGIGLSINTISGERIVFIVIPETHPIYNCGVIKHAILSQCRMNFLDTVKAVSEINSLVSDVYNKLFK